MDFDECLNFMELGTNFLDLKPAGQHEVLEDKYLQLCKKYHPDNKLTGNSDKFTRLQHAYDILRVYIGMSAAGSKFSKVSEVSESSEVSGLFVRCTLSELYTGCRKTVKHNNYVGHITVPAGTMDGQSFILEMYNAMGQSVGCYPIIVLQINDTMLTREGSNLHLTLNISSDQALYGDPVKVTILGQIIVDVPVQIGASDQKTIIPNCGMPILGKYEEYGHGDLIVSYRVTFNRA